MFAYGVVFGVGLCLVLAGWVILSRTTPKPGEISDRAWGHGGAWAMMGAGLFLATVFGLSAYSEANAGKALVLVTNTTAGIRLMGR